MASSDCWRSWPGCAIRKAAAHGTSSRIWQSIAPHTIEEAYEVADAIAAGDPRPCVTNSATCCSRSYSRRVSRRNAGTFDFDAVAGAMPTSSSAGTRTFPGSADCGAGSRAPGRCTRGGARRERQAAARSTACPWPAGAHPRLSSARGPRVSASTGRSRWRARQDREEMRELVRARVAGTRRRARNWATCCSAWRNRAAPRDGRRSLRCATRARNSSDASERHSSRASCAARSDRRLQAKRRRSAELVELLAGERREAAHATRLQRSTGARAPRTAADSVQAWTRRDACRDSYDDTCPSTRA